MPNPADCGAHLPGRRLCRPAVLLAAMVMLAAGLVGCRALTPAPLPPPAPAKPATSPAAGDCTSSGYCGQFNVGGPLQASAWLDSDRMYLADGAGKVQLLNVTTGQATTALDSDGFYKGITLLNGRLYLSDAGPVAAALRAAAGTAAQQPRMRLAEHPAENMAELARQAGHRVLSWRANPDGSLDDRQIVIDRIVAFSLFHGVNGLVNDGEYIYLSIGHPARNIAVDEPLSRRLAARDLGGGRADWWGTIISFRPPDNAAAIYASGLRNTYGLTIAPDGTIYGADNNENFYTAAAAGQPEITHQEELNALRPGGFYGYPIYGTNVAPPQAARKVTEPVALIPGVAATAAHANRDGVYIAYTAPGQGFVLDRFDYATFAAERVFHSGERITALLEREGLLYAATRSGSVLIIDPGLRTGRLEQRLRAAGQLKSAAPWQVYFHAASGALNYFKEPCAPADTSAQFFLHLTPADPADLPPARRAAGFDARDFSFHPLGERGEGYCLTTVPLPGYPIARAATGQFIPGQGKLWSAEFSLEQ